MPSRPDHKVGTVVVICPSCGKACTATVVVNQVSCHMGYLTAFFNTSTVTHECPGGQT